MGYVQNLHWKLGLITMKIVFLKTCEVRNQVGTELETFPT